MPEAAAFTEDQIAPQFMMSPNTLRGAAFQAIREGVTPTYGKKKGRRKRKEKKGSAPASSSQSAPTKQTRALERIPIKWRDIHWLGEPILPPHVVQNMTGDMRSLHDGVLQLEKDLLRMKSPTYPVFVVKVPKGMGFLDKSPAEVFFIRFDDIFNMFHLKRLHPTLVRLVALSMAHQIIREDTPGIAIMDPYYMLESNLRNPGTG